MPKSTQILNQTVSVFDATWKNPRAEIALGTLANRYHRTNFTPRTATARDNYRGSEMTPPVDMPDNWSWLDSEIIRQSADIGSTAMHVLLVLAMYADNETRECYPSLSTIAGIMGCTTRTVRNSIRLLKTHGFVSVKSGGGADSNRYKILSLPPKEPGKEISSPSHKDRKEISGDRGSQFPGTGEASFPLTNSVELKNISTPKSKTRFSEQDLETANWIFSLIRILNPGNREPNFKCWANTVRLMRERDKRTDKEIRELFLWANNESFWKTIILSPDNLRNKWDKLRIQKNHRHEGNGNGRAAADTKPPAPIRYFETSKK